MVILFKQINRACLRLILVHSLLLIFFMIWAQDSYADGETAKTDTFFIKSEIHSLTTTNQQTYRYQLEYYLNKYGEKSVRILLIEAHWLSKNTQLTVLQGRDTDGDQIIESWFYTDGAMVKSLQRKPKYVNVWPVARDILSEFSLNESRWISTLISRELLANLFFTVEGEIIDERELVEMQIDLLDLDYKIKDLEISQLNPLLLQELKKVSNSGWKALIERYTQGRTNDRQLRLLGDVALYTGAGLVLNGIKFLILKSLSSEIISSVKVYLSQTIEQQKLWITKISKKASYFLPTKKSGALISDLALGTNGKSLFPMIRFSSPPDALVWLSKNSFLTNSLTQIGGIFKSAAKASWDQKGFIAMAQTIQLAVESHGRGYWTFSEVPLILEHPVKSTEEFVKQVTNDKGLAQNFGYMTLQTTVLTGASEALEHRGASFGTKFLVSSMITIIDSTTVNIVVQGKSDYARIGFDTAWELLIGGNQIHLDMHTLHWSEKLAARSGKPALKFVGYLLAAVDQSVGYIMYNKVTTKFFESKETSESHDSNNSNKTNPDLAVNNQKMVLIPVMAPQ